MDTATKAIENVPFRDRIAKLDKPALIAIADEEFSLKVDEKLTKVVIIDQLIRIYEETANSARTLNEKSAALFLSADKTERLVDVKFLPLDFPNAVVEFANDGGLGLRDPKNPKRNPNGLSKMPRFKLIPGEVYALPIRIIRALEKLIYTGSKPITDTNTGMITGNMPVIKPRFMLTPVLSDEQMREMGTTLS